MRPASHLVEGNRARSGLVELAVTATSSGRSVLTRMYSTGCLAARPTPEGVFLVGATANPIGGDASEVQLRVGEGATLEVRSSSASVARRGRVAGPSSMAITATVSSGASLVWCTEPGVAAAGACHQVLADVLLGPDARLAWYDAVVLGRHGEDCGSWSSRLSVRRGETPVVVSDLSLGPAFGAWRSRAVLGGARCVLTLVVVDRADRRSMRTASTARYGGARGAVLPLAAGGVQLVALGDDFANCAHLLGQLVARLDTVDWVPSLPGTQ